MTGDAHDFRVINDFAQESSWLHGVMIWFAQYGIVLLALALVAGWWLGRRSGDTRRIAISVWGAVAALAALAVAQPVAHAADEQRPFVALPHVLRLIPHPADVGFPSDHATAAGAVAAALCFVSWRLGVVAWVVALLVAFSRVYVGVHFPDDVAAGLALGAVVALIGIPTVVPLLSRLAELVRTIAPALVQPRPRR